MIKLLDDIKVSAVLFAATLAIPTTTFAGATSIDAGSCSTNSVAGTGHCQGTYADIKSQLGDPGRWAAFRKSVFNTSSGSGGLEFAMEVSGKLYVCYGNANMLDTWNTIMASGQRIWFSIDFKFSGNQSGECTYLFVDSSSANH